MPKVTNFAFCETTRVDGDNPQAINLLQVINSSPEGFSFSLLFSITGFSASEDHNGHIILSDPNNNVLIESEKYVIEKDEQFGVEPNNLVTGITMGVEFKVQFVGQGIHRVDLYFDDEKIDEFFIPVLLDKEKGGE